MGSLTSNVIAAPLEAVVNHASMPPRSFWSPPRALTAFSLCRSRDGDDVPSRDDAHSIHPNRRRGDGASRYTRSSYMGSNTDWDSNTDWGSSTGKACNKYMDTCTRIGEDIYSSKPGSDGGTERSPASQPRQSAPTPISVHLVFA